MDYSLIVEKLKSKSKSDAEVIAWERSFAKVSAAAAELKNEIIKAEKVNPIQGVFSFMPTEMTRITPFFPMNRGHMKERPLKELVWENSWGRVRISGKQLSVYDESVLMAVLHLVGRYKSMTFETTRNELCGILDVTSCKSNYKAVWSSLERLTSTIINLEVWGVGKLPGKKRNTRMQMINPMLSGAKINHETGKILITVNEYFISMYGDGLFTSIDMDLRNSLKGDISKALYRFVIGQKNRDYQCHILTMAKAVNVNTDMEMKEIRKRFRKGFQELKKNKVIKQYRILKNDVINIER
jgi:hypothetical protein